MSKDVVRAFSFIGNGMGELYLAALFLAVSSFVEADFFLLSLFLFAALVMKFSMRPITSILFAVWIFYNASIKLCKC